MKKTPNPTDVHVGSRVRLRRMILKMSQEKLGETLGITFQQVQKYEKGTNRIGASRLQHIARILDVPISFFFDGGPGAVEGATAEPPTPDLVMQFLSTPDGLALNQAFARIADQQLRRRVIDLVKSMAPPETEPA